MHYSHGCVSLATQSLSSAVWNSTWEQQRGDWRLYVGWEYPKEARFFFGWAGFLGGKTSVRNWKVLVSETWLRYSSN